jgi:DNA-binding beta-propeller fold protein YncE
MAETTYTQTAGMDGDTTTDNVAELAQQAVAAAAAAAADLLLTDADTVATAADRAQTTADRVAVAADLVATNQDTIDTAADAVSTASDVVSTNADAATTTQDAIDTAADVVTTNADAATTTQDAIDTAADATAAANSASAASTSASEAAASVGSVVVDAASVTAAGALMDSELTSIADIKALDQSVISGATPTFGIANVTLDDTSLVVSDTTNLQTFAEGVDSALLRARGTGFTSTYVSTVTIGGTTFAQPAVNGEIHSDQGYFAIAYAGATGITVATLSAPSTYVYVDNAGNLQQQTSTPTRQDWSRKMFTMRIAVDTSAETIIGFEYLGNPIGHYANSIRDLYKALLEQGVPFKGGQTITGRAADLGFDVSAGTLMEFGGTGNIDNANVLSIDAVANAEYTLIERTGAGTTGQTSLVKSWDNAESITALGSGTFVAHRVYRFSNGTFVIQYGQGNYANIVLARAGLLIEDYVLNERLTNATFFGWWIVGETATNTGGTTLTEFREYTIGVQGGSSSGLAGCLLKGNNLSDLLDVSAARTNLGLGTVATTAASAYATAAQGTLADDAAPLASPTFTGTPAVPTATLGTSTTQIASTAFVLANGSSSSVAALTPAATVDISLADDDYFTITLDQDTTFTVSNVEAVDTFNLAITGADVVGAGYDIANASYDSVSFSITAQEATSSGMAFNNDGTKMYVVGFTKNIFQYTLSTAWDVSTASYDSVSFSVNGQDTDPQGLFFKPDGTKVYVIGRINDTVFQYSLSTAYDLSTTSYDSVSFSVASQETNPSSAVFKPDGTKMYVVGFGSDTVFQYTLSTAWVVSSASYDSVSFSVASQAPVPRSVVFNDDGTHMYVVGNSIDTVFQYTLTTGFDLSTASYDSVSFNVASQDTAPYGLAFDTNGSKMYVLGTANDTVFQYSTATSVTATTTYPASFVFTSGATPVPPANGVTDILEAQTTNGGTTWVVSQFGSGKATSYQDAVVVLTGATPTVNLAAAGEYRLTTSGNTTFTVSNPPADGYTTTKTLRITQGGTAYSLTFWAGIEAIGGAIPAAPALNETKEYTLRASTVSGTTIYVLTETGVVS